MRNVRTAASLAVLATLMATAAAVPATAAVSAHGQRMHKPFIVADPGATAGDAFGHQVAIDAAGTEAIVGAYGTDAASGKAYLYTEKSGKWSEVPTERFTDPATGANHFGYSVALSPNGETAYVGADHANDGTVSEGGAVYVYQSVHGKWPSKPTTTISDPGKEANDFFGVDISVSSDGGTVVVGAPGFTASGNAEVGRVYVYTAAHGKLPATPSSTIVSPTPSTRGFFGYSVSVSNNAKGKGVLAVGAYVTSIGTVAAEGAAYIFDAKSSHSWVLAQGGRLADPGKTKDDFFGGVVTIDGAGTLVMVGAQDETEKSIADAGAVYLYLRKAGGWHESETLTGPANSSANFAYPAVSSNGKVALTAAPSATIKGHQGAGEVFTYSGSGTTLTLGATTPDPTGGSATAQDNFGNASALNSSGTVAVISAPATGGKGVVYIYAIS